MARKRRKKGNPLLTRIFVISVVAHAIALPVAAHFGAFKNIGKGVRDSHIVMLANNLKDDPEHAKEKAKEKVKKVEHKTSDSKATDKAKGNNLPQPKVVTGGAASGSGENSGPKAESGTGTAGRVPDGPKPTPPIEPASEPKKEPIPEPNTPKKPEPSKPIEPKIDPIKPAEPKPKKIVEASVLDAPEPEIPDEFRAESLDKTLIVEAQIDSGGHPTNITVSSSTGIKELDKIGLETAKKYRFKPATIDGTPTGQRVRFRIIFKVD